MVGMAAHPCLHCSSVDDAEVGSLAAEERATCISHWPKNLSSTAVFLLLIG
jgi:hypothetical protein